MTDIVGLATLVMQLQQRVAALERRPPAGSEASQPNYLFVTATGQTGALFTGGVLLNENTNAVYTAQDALGWRDATGTIRELIMGFAMFGAHNLNLTSQADATDNAQVVLQSTPTGAAGSADVIASATDNTGATATLTLLDSLGRSSYLEAGSVLHSKVGSGTFAFPGGSDLSTSQNLAVPGASGNCFGLVTCAALTNGQGACVGLTANNGNGTVLVQCQTGNLSTPANTVTCPFAYLIWGT